jgi:hypothetical protein
LLLGYGVVGVNERVEGVEVEVAREGGNGEEA